MIPFIAALAVMAALTEVHQPKPPQAACADTIYVVIYRHVVDGPFPMAEDDSFRIYDPGVKP